MSLDVLFHWGDYLTFSISMLLSIGVGIYYGFFHDKQESTAEFLLGNRKMHILPVSISMFLSWFSAIAFLGDPVEMYYYGSVYCYVGLGYVLAFIPICWYFAPRLNQLGLVSVYELLEVTFNRCFRVVLSFMSVLLLLPYMGVCLYAPSLALQQVTGIRLEVIIISIGLIVVFYSTLGGIKAVVWTDTIQMVVLISGYMAMFIGGYIHVGGFSKMWIKGNEMGRTNFNNFAFDPLQRATFWSCITTGLIRVCGPYIADQAFVQRFLVVSTPRQARLVALFNVPMFACTIVTLYLTGLIIGAYFTDCDPLQNGTLTRIDQIIPYMMLQTVGFLRGVPGLFIAGIVSASLSSLSSMFNSSATLLTRDLVELLYERIKHKTMPDKSAALSAKIFTVIMGLVVIIVALGMKFFDQNLFQLCLTVTSLVDGPKAGVFFLALVFGWVDWLSCLIGYIVGTGVTMWLGLGALWVGTSHQHLPVYTHGCPATNATENISHTPYSLTSDVYITSSTPPKPAGSIYDFSPFLYYPLSCILVITITLLLSAIRKWILGYEKPVNTSMKKKDDKHGRSVDFFHLKTIPN